MDPYSFLNTAHTAYFAELYDQYIINPEEVEPSWRAFFKVLNLELKSQKNLQTLRMLKFQKIFLKNLK